MSIKSAVKKVANVISKEVEVLKGNESKDKTYTSEKSFADDEAAKREFVAARERLFDVNAWSDIQGLGTAGFKIHNAAGTPTDHKIVMTGDFIKIDLPGPVDKYWVEVIDVKEEPDLAEFTVKPSHDPSNIENPEEIDHFFHEDARSTFRVQRIGNAIKAMEIGTNEAINNQGQESGGDAAEHTLVAVNGWAFFQKNQWKNLTDYLVGHQNDQGKIS